MKIAPGSLERRILLTEKSEKLPDLAIAFDHAVFGRRGAVIEEGSSGKAADVESLKLHQIGKGELVIDLVIGIGVQNDLCAR